MLFGLYGAATDDDDGQGSQRCVLLAARVEKSPTQRTCALSNACLTSCSGRRSAGAREMEMRRPGRGPSSRAHVSSRGRRRTDGCRRAGTACWARDPARFFLLPNRFAGIAWPAGGVPKTGRAAAAHSRSWSRRRAPAASSVKSRVPRAAPVVLQRCPGSSLLGAALPNNSN